MDVNNFKVDIVRGEISWYFNNEFINVFTPNIIEARVDKERQYIFVLQGNNFIESGGKYLNYIGSNIFSYKCKPAELSYGKKEKIQVFDNAEIVCANVYIKHNKILVAMKENKNQIKLLGYNLLGEEKFSHKLSVGFIPVYFTSFKNNPSVICDVPKADNYGRSRYRYTVDFNTGILSDKQLSY